MKKLLIALLLTVAAISSAAAQLAIAPAGAIGPDGSLSYVVPTGSQSAIAGPVSDGCSFPYPGFGPPVAAYYPMGPVYPISYPMLWVPTGPPSASPYPSPVTHR